MENYRSLYEKLGVPLEGPPKFGPLSLDLESRTVRAEGSNEAISLGPDQYQILWLLVRARGNIVSSNEILDFIHRESTEEDKPVSNVVQQLISTLRKKVNTLVGETITIENIHDTGYFLKLNQTSATT